MANDNKKINKLVSEQDDDPTAELELLSMAACAESEDMQEVESETDANTFDFDKLESEIGDADETIANLKSESKSRAENISKLEFDIEHLRSRSSGLKKENKVREEVSKNLTAELKAIHKKQTKTSKLLIKRDKEVNSLRARLSDHEQSLQESREREQETQACTAEIQSKLDAAEEKLAALAKAAQRGDTDIAKANKQPLAEQTGMVGGESFEINELGGQIARTESYADELRRQLQDQLLLSDELQTRQKHLEISLTGANSRIEELSCSIEELRAENQNLLEESSRRKDEFEKELRHIRFELGEAQETISESESANHQLTSDLVATREFKMNLEDQLSTNDEKSRATIARLEQKLVQLDTQIEELNYKLTTKDNAITALLNELTSRSKTIESIGEIEDVALEVDDPVSEQIDDRVSAERDRITRLLVGKIDGQKLRFPLFKNRLTIGRTGHNDIQLKAPHISRRHAVIVSDDDSTRIVDWGSKNGVFVNTEQIKEKILRNGDIVRIGTADFKFEERPKR